MLLVPYPYPCGPSHFSECWLSFQLSFQLTSASLCLRAFSDHLSPPAHIPDRAEVPRNEHLLGSVLSQWLMEVVYKYSSSLVSWIEILQSSCYSASTRSPVGLSSSCPEWSLELQHTIYWLPFPSHLIFLLPYLCFLRSPSKETTHTWTCVSETPTKVFPNGRLGCYCQSKGKWILSRQKQVMSAPLGWKIGPFCFLVCELSFSS